MSVSTFAPRQRGMSLLGLIFTIGLASFFITVLLKMGPLYLNYWTIRSIMTEVEKESGTIEGGVHGIADKIERRMEVNSVADISIRDFAIKKTDDKTYSVTVNYEQRTHLFFNVDAVAAFTYQVEVQTK